MWSPQRPAQGTTSVGPPPRTEGKGKERERTPPFGRRGEGAGSEPTVTYRHVLSPQTLNPHNPLRVVSVCDVDAAYALFEAARLGIDGQKVPLAVQQWQGLIAVNYPARKFGITRHETATEAKKKCPELICVHVATYKEGEEQAGYWENPRPETHKVSLDPYRRESKKIVAVFREMCPTALIEKASIDESYFDLTAPVRDLLLERYPHLRDVPPEGLDTPLPPPPKVPWKGLGNLIPIDGEGPASISVPGRERRHDVKGSAVAAGEASTSRSPSPVPAAESDLPSGPQLDALAAPGDEQFDTRAEDSMEQGEFTRTWSDVALAFGAEIMAKVRRAVRDRLTYTTSAGIARNKPLAKLCSSWKKPDAQTVLRNGAIGGFLEELPFQKIRFLGGKLGEAVAKEWDSNTVGDLWSVSLEEMQRRLGEESVWVYDVLRGVDYSEVTEREANKSMLAAKNVQPPITRTEEALRWLKVLSAELIIRLREQREERPSLWPKTLVLHYRKPSESARSRQCAFPYTRNLNAEVVLKLAEKLWKESLGEQIARGSMGKVSNISLGFHGLEEGETGQKNIEGFFGKAPSVRPKRPMGEAVESTDGGAASWNPQLGPSARSSPAPPSKKRKPPRGLDVFFASQAVQQPTVGSSSAGARSKLPTPQSGSELSSAEGFLTWVCPQCSKVITVSAEKDQEAEGALYNARQGHEDWHFAESLAEADRAINGAAAKPPGSPRSATRRDATRVASSRRGATTAPSQASGRQEKKHSRDKGQTALSSFFGPSRNR